MKQEILWLINEKYGGQLTDKAKKDITRLEKGEVVDYVIGHKNFCGCKIDLRYKPLIPRDETEFWIQKVLGACLSRNVRLLQRQARSLIVHGAILRLRRASPKLPVKANQLALTSANFAEANHAILPANTHEKQFPTRCLKVLDIFAGSGCCGIAILKNIPNSHCDFVDIDDNCLKQIRLNLKLNGIDKKRYRVIKSDVFGKIKGQYDLILANPPYIGLKEKEKVQKSVLDFEPHQALFAKNNGLYFIEKFLKQAKNYLAPEGKIYMEFGFGQKNDVAKLLKKFGYKNFGFQKDQFNKYRFFVISS